jgi:hypothetical protein
MKTVPAEVTASKELQEEMTPLGLISGVMLKFWFNTKHFMGR